jgi:hypothetical protein
VPPRQSNLSYLSTKRAKFGHLLTLVTGRRDVKSEEEERDDKPK